MSDPTVSRAPDVHGDGSTALDVSSVPALTDAAVFADRFPTSDSPAFEGLALQEQRVAREEARDRRRFLIQTVSTTIGALGLLVSTSFLIRQNSGN